MELVSLEKIREAQQIVKAVSHHTPLWQSVGVAQRVGCPDLHLKMENFQRTGSFKVRGASVKISNLSEDEKKRGLVTVSAGNHAQGLAMAAREFGSTATIFMSEISSPAKVEATRSYGAQVVLKGRSFAEAETHARKFAKRHNSIWVSAYDDPDIIAGQGTIGLEILQDLPDVDTLLVPIGGGGLFAGVATAIKELRPKCRVVGVQAAGANGAVNSWRQGTLLPRHTPLETIADGIAVKGPSDLTFAHIQKYADDMITVAEHSLEEAILLLLTRTKAVVEPAGAATLAALLQYPGIGQGKTVALISGGNIDLFLLSGLIERGLAESGRFGRFSIRCSDKPGGLARILEVVAAEGGNIIEVIHNRLAAGLDYGQTEIELLIEARNQEHIDRLYKALSNMGRVEMEPQLSATPPRTRN